MRQLIALLTILTVATPLLQAEPPLETEDDKTIYAIGSMVGQNVAPQLQGFGLTEEEKKVFLAGFLDALAGADSKVEIDVYGPKIQGFAEARKSAVAAKEKEAGQAYVQKMAAEPGAEKLASGVVFFETAAGTGENPAATDQVKVHYHGTLIDGTVFDSSVKRGEPATFPLNQVIPCWTESLQKMKPGGKAKLICPSETAYGDNGAGVIKPGSTLIFDVELLEIVKQ